jgi:hypothetical protein
MFSGNAFADLLLGLPATDQVFVTGPYLSQQSKHFAVFGQDEWHISKSLTFSYGLRWEVQPPSRRRTAILPISIRPTGGLVVPDIASAKLPPAPFRFVYSSTRAPSTRFQTRLTRVRRWRMPAKQAIPSGCATRTIMISIRARVSRGGLLATTRPCSGLVLASTRFLASVGKLI